jgi:hypothetical protein
MNNQSKIQFKLCCGGNGCPTVSQTDVNSNLFEITDDFGGKILLQKDELIELTEKLAQYDLGNIS